MSVQYIYNQLVFKEPHMRTSESDVGGEGDRVILCDVRGVIKIK